MSQIKTGIVLSYASLGLRFAVGFFLSPFILEQLGPSEYGVYMIAGSIVSWLAMCDFGLTASTTKFLSEYQAKGDRAGEAHHLGQIAAVFSIMGLFVLASGLCIYPYLGDIFNKFNEEELRIARILYLLTLFNCALMFPTRSMGGISEARQKFTVPGLVGLGFSLINIVGTVCLLLMGFKAIGLTVFSVSSGIIGLIWNIVYCFCILKARMTWNGWDFPLCKALFSFSIWMFLDRLINIMNTGSGSFIIGITQGAEEVTVYSYGLTIFQHFFTASGCIAGFFLPKVVSMVVNGASNKEQTDMMIKVGRAQLIVLACMFFGIIFFGREFFHLWIGKTIGSRTNDCWFVTIAILIPYGFLLLQALGWQILQARNCMKYRVSVLSCSSFLSLVLGSILSVYYGCKGLAIGTATSIILGQGIFMNWFYWKKLGLEIPRFFKECLQRAWLWLPLFLLTAWSLNTIFDTPQWSTFFLKISIFSLMYGLIILGLYANKEERILFLPFSKKNKYYGRTVKTVH